MKKPSAVFLLVICALSVVVSFPNRAVSAETEQTERSASFVTEALGFNSSQFTASNMGGRAGIDGDRMNIVGYIINSEAGSLNVACEYPTKGQGMWYVALTINRTTNQLPVYVQLSANVAERARDFLMRYLDWSCNPSLNDATSMLDRATISRNMTVTGKGLIMTVDSNPYFVSFYWEQIVNGSEYRGIGITFAGKYVFFRDDRSIFLEPKEPPASIFTSVSPYISGYSVPETRITDFPLDKNFTFMTPRPAPIFELHLSPEAQILGPVREIRQFSGYYTFMLAEPLKPNTTYVETILVGQSIPPDFDSAPISIASWSFTTGNSIVAAEPTIAPTNSVDLTEASSPSLNVESPFPPMEDYYPLPFPTEIIYFITAVAAVVMVAVGIISQRKHGQPRPPRNTP
jgi:hypothetical protein